MFRRNEGNGEHIMQFEEEWVKAEPIVHSLLYQRPVTPAAWQDLFYHVYKITSWVTDGPQKIRNILTSNIDRYVWEANNRIRSLQTDESLLKAYIKEWNRFYRQASILPLPFKKIDESTQPKRRSVSDVSDDSIRSVMLEKWNMTIFVNISDNLLGEALRLVKEERDGNIIDSDNVIGIRESFVALNDKIGEDPLQVYRHAFERNFIEQTSEYYNKICGQLLNEMGVLEYMVYADKKLEEEQLRAQRYLEFSSPTAGKHMEKAVIALVENFEDTILAECSKLIAQRDVERLQRLYRLIRRTRSGIETVLKCIDTHIRTEGLNDMRNNADSLATDPEKYVQQLLLMFDKFSSLVREGFCDDARLLTARDQAFSSVVNDCSIFKTELFNKKGRAVSVESKCAELLANYCDLLLRKTQLSKKLTSDEIDEKLGQVLLVLKYVDNKDVFMRFHRAHLSRRLILEMSADQEKEEMMVTKLRECGMPSDAVNKLSRMLQDIELNKDMNSSFKKALTGTNNNKSVADSINLKVLNGGAWGRGGSEKVRFSLPRELEEFVPEMEAFYKKQHNGRKLCWMHHWSSGTMVFGTASGGRFDLEITTFQMAVLFCFNDRAHEKISLETLRLATELPDAELNRTLLSLVAYPKMRSQILVCDVQSPNIMTRDFTDSTKFFINHSFHLVKNGKVQQRGKVNLIGRLQLSLEPNTEKEHESIVALREFRVQEGIVKILKTRKTIDLDQLKKELGEILKPLFTPNKKLIKEQIDWLLDNNYMTRGPDMNTFMRKYLEMRFFLLLSSVLLEVFYAQPDLNPIHQLCQPCILGANAVKSTNKLPTVKEAEKKTCNTILNNDLVCNGAIEVAGIYLNWTPAEKICENFLMCSSATADKKRMRAPARAAKRPDELAMRVMAVFDTDEFPAFPVRSSRQSGFNYNITEAEDLEKFFREQSVEVNAVIQQFIERFQVALQVYLNGITSK
ncbi:unnamed protein product [Caenorhabditis sp. 36 PRJEB53466]|nr:unnamed protein product [Caenorhabditis sp. 36 PRJEB53466]